MTVRKSTGLVWGFYSREQIDEIRKWVIEYLRSQGGVVRHVAKEIGVTPQTLSGFILDGTMYPRLPTAIKLDKFMQSKKV